MVFEYIERVHPALVQHESEDCAAQCGNAGQLRIGPCVPRGFVFNPSTGEESELSDRGKPFCGGGLCCRAKDDAHPGDPGCFDAGCVGRHCCWDPSTDRAGHEPILDAASAARIGSFPQAGKTEACYVTGATFGNFDPVPAPSACTLRFQGVRRWWNKCGMQIPHQTHPGERDPKLNMDTGWDERTKSFRWSASDYKKCIYFPTGARTGGSLTHDGSGPKQSGRRILKEGGSAAPGDAYHHHDASAASAPAGGTGAVRSYVRYETYIDPKEGYFEVVEGQEPLVQWRISPAFKSEEFRMALLWVDNARGSRQRGFMPTLPGHARDDEVVVGFLYNIDTEADNTFEARSDRFPPHRRAINGTNSWQRSTWMGPCTYPLGFPPYGSGTSYRVQLLIYRSRVGRSIEPPVTWPRFLEAVEDDLVGDCSFRPVAKGLRKEEVRSAEREGLRLTRPGEIAKRCDGLYGSQDLTADPKRGKVGGHNQTVPCGAYGCDCVYSPGNCGSLG